MPWVVVGRGGVQVKLVDLVGVDLELQCGVVGGLEQVMVFPQFGAGAEEAMPDEASVPGACGIWACEADLVHAIDGLGGEMEATEGFRGSVQHQWPEVFHEPPTGVGGGLVKKLACVVGDVHG